MMAEYPVRTRDGGRFVPGSLVRVYHPTVPDHVMYEGVVTLGPDGKGFGVIATEDDGLPVWRIVHWDSLQDVECPECDALIEEAMQWRDWQSLDMGVYCDKHAPENAEEP